MVMINGIKLMDQDEEDDDDSPTRRSCDTKSNFRFC